MSYIHNLFCYRANNSIYTGASIHYLPFSFLAKSALINNSTYSLNLPRSFNFFASSMPALLVS